MTNKIVCSLLKALAAFAITATFSRASFAAEFTVHQGKRYRATLSLNSVEVRLNERDPPLVAASPLVADKVDADGFARCVFDRCNIWRPKNLDFAIVGFACFYRVERRCPQNSSNCSPVRVQHASRNADVFVAGLDEQCGRRSWAASLCDLIDHSEIVIHFSRAEIQGGGAFAVNRLLSLNLWRAQFGSLFFQGRHRRCVCILSIGSYRHQHETSDAANCNHKNHKDLLRNEPYCADRNKCSFHRLPCG